MLTNLSQIKPIHTFRYDVIDEFTFNKVNNKKDTMRVN